MTLSLCLTAGVDFKQLHVGIETDTSRLFWPLADFAPRAAWLA
ncbi:hypothetical protein [Lentibacter sp.]